MKAQSEYQSGNAPSMTIDIADCRHEARVDLLIIDRIRGRERTVIISRSNIPVSSKLGDDTF